MRLRQVLANGLSNAAKFTDKGSVTLRVRQVAESDTAISLEFTVIDTGCGISAQAMPTLFQPFRQADSSTARRYGGTGLGLVITKELLALMGGRVELESEEGAGTRMTITVALEKDGGEEEKEGRDTGRSTPELRRGASGASAKVVVEAGEDAALDGVRQRRRPETVRILVAEDNELLKSLTVKLLEKMHVSCFASAGSVPGSAERKGADPRCHPTVLSSRSARWTMARRRSRRCTDSATTSS